MTDTNALESLNRHGFAVVHAVYRRDECSAFALDIAAHLNAAVDSPSVLRSRGVIYAARSLLDLWPAAHDVWRRTPLVGLLSTTLGADFGLVRAMYFDKPPDRTWALAWHRDLAIAVTDNTLPSQRFTKPTTKSGVPQIEAPLDVLQNMLTLRIHLDDVTVDNGPLLVIPESHRDSSVSWERHASRPILTRAGDVLAMRPLLLHSSPSSSADSRQHRRVVHLEFSGTRNLGDGFEWHGFVHRARPFNESGDDHSQSAFQRDAAST